MSKKWQTLFAVNLALTSTVSFAYFCPQYINEIVQPVFRSSTASLQANVASVDAALSTQLEVNNQRLMAAIAVLTKQKAVSANQGAEASRVAGQMVSEGLQAQSKSERVTKARLDFGGEFGQGYSPCKVYANRVTLAENASALDGERRRRVQTEVYAAPGAYGDRLAAQRTMVNNRAEFCTEDQARSGICANAGRKPGADLMVGTLFEPAMEGEDLYRAKQLFVNHAVGLPDAPVPKSQANTSASQAYVLSKAHKDALMSPAINSFKALQLDSSGVDSAHGASGLPLSVQLRNEVSRYGGDSIEYESWTKSLTGLVERGALVELLKMKALDLFIMERQYRQYERMEANLAALVSIELENSGLPQQARDAAMNVSRSRMKAQVQ